MSKTAPFSSSVAFLTPPTFPAPAPRKQFFDPLPKKILGFRTRKGRPPRRQYLARARLEFRASLRVVVSSRARAFGISCGLLACGAGGWLAALAADGSYAAPAGLRVWYLLRLPGWRRWRRWRMAGRPADCRSWPPSCRPSAQRTDTPTAAPSGAAHPDRLPPVDDLPP